MNSEKLLHVFDNIEDQYIMEYINTMIDPAPVPVKTRFRKMAFAAIIAALIVGLLGCTYVMVSESEWYQALFSSKNKQPLAVTQADYITSNTHKFKNCVTANGFTITLESAFASSDYACLKLRIENDSGEAMDADLYSFDVDFTADPPERFFSRSDAPSAAYDFHTRLAEDEDKTDSSAIVLYEVLPAWDNRFGFEPGIDYKIWIPNLYADYDARDGHPYHRECLSENGSWEIHFEFDRIEDDEIELIKAPVRVSYQNVSIGLTSLRLRGMSVIAEYADRNDGKGIVCLSNAVVVLKDGTRISMRPHTFGFDRAILTLNAPAPPSEVDYIELPDSQIIIRR